MPTTAIVTQRVSEDRVDSWFLIKMPIVWRPYEPVWSRRTYCALQFKRETMKPKRWKWSSFRSKAVSPTEDSGQDEHGSKKGEMVEPRGIEPLTFALRTRRSPN